MGLPRESVDLPFLLGMYFATGKHKYFIVLVANTIPMCYISPASRNNGYLTKTPGLFERMHLRGSERFLRFRRCRRYPDLRILLPQITKARFGLGGLLLFLEDHFDSG